MSARAAGIVLYMCGSQALCLLRGAVQGPATYANGCLSLQVRSVGVVDHLCVCRAVAAGVGPGRCLGQAWLSKLQEVGSEGFQTTCAASDQGQPGEVGMF